MGKQNELIQLPPLGGGFRVSKQDGMEAATEEQIREIEDKRKDLLARFGYITHDRPLIVHKTLINKTCFVLSHIKEAVTINGVEAVIADQGLLFSDTFSAFQQNRAVMRENRVKTGRSISEYHTRSCEWALHNCPDEYREPFRAALDALHAYAPQMEVVDASDRARIMNANKNDRSLLKTIAGLQNMSHKLQLASAVEDDGQAAARMLAVLRSWVPDIAIDERTVMRFSLYFSQPYVNCYRNCCFIKNDAGHYQPEYTTKDYHLMQDYEARCEQLRSLREGYCDWAKRHPFPFDAAETFWREDSASATACPLQLIAILLDYYEKGTRTHADSLEATRVANLLNQLQKPQQWRTLLPFRLLAVCVQSGTRLIRQAGAVWVLERETLAQFTVSPYREKPSQRKQRFARLQLLCQLCEHFSLKDDAVEENLLYFLKYHGCNILSEEEAACWKEILGQYGLLDRPVSLALQYYEDTNNGFDLQLDTLLFYQSTSPLDLGGYAAFYAAFPHAFRGRNMRTWFSNELELLYLKAWNDPDRNIEDLKTKYEEVQNRVRLSAEMKQWIHNYDLESAAKQHKTTKPINQEELQLLLLESAIRASLVRKAKAKLLQEANDRIALLTQPPRSAVSTK